MRDLYETNLRLYSFSTNGDDFGSVLVYFPLKVTNAQSRTAIVIMPPLFIFAVTSEQKLTHRMHEVASENEHNIEVSYNNRFLKCDTYFIFKNDTPTQSIKLFLDDRMG